MIKKAYLFCTSGNETKERSFTIKGNMPMLACVVLELCLKCKFKLSNEINEKQINIVYSMDGISSFDETSSVIS